MSVPALAVPPTTPKPPSAPPHALHWLEAVVSQATSQASARATRLPPPDVPPTVLAKLVMKTCVVAMPAEEKAE